MKAYEVNVWGKVQLVGYRRYILSVAQELGLAGFVENKPGGSVQIFIQGAEEKIKGFLEKALNPAYPAKVLDLDIIGAHPKPEHKYFTIKFGSLEEELQEGFGAIQEISMDYWREFREFAEKTDKDFQTIMGIYGEISKKPTEIMNTLLEGSKKTSQILDNLRGESRVTREILNKNLELMRQAIEKLGQKN